MFNQLFGNYLVNEDIISYNKLRELLENLKNRNFSKKFFQARH